MNSWPQRICKNHFAALSAFQSPSMKIDVAIVWDSVLKNIPVVGTFLAIMAVFGLFAPAVAAYSGSRISKIDEDYTPLLGNDVDGTIGIMRANRALQNTRAAIGDMLLSRSASLTQSAEEEFIKSAARFAGNAALKERWEAF